MRVRNHLVTPYNNYKVAATLCFEVVYKVATTFSLRLGESCSTVIKTLNFKLFHKVATLNAAWLSL